MGTDYEREQREQREDERQRAELEADRRAEMAPALRVLRTPRDAVAEYIEQAATSLGRDPFDRLGALMWLDRAREVLGSPNVVDGAALLRGTLEEARDAAEEGEYGMVIGRLDEAIELLRRQVRVAPGDEIPVADDDADELRVAKRRAVAAVLGRHQLGVGLAVGEVLGDDVIDEIVTAVETGI